MTLETLDVRTMSFTVLAYPVALILGVPAYFILRRMGRVELPWIVVVGMILASALGAVFFWMPRSYEGAIAARNTVLFCALGAATGVVFWLVGFASLRSNNRWRGP
jgi:hypothetical protein